MQLDQIFSANNLPALLAVGCCLLCGVGLAVTVLTPVFNLLGGLLELAGALFELGPIPGCGCVVALVVVGGVVLTGLFLASVLSACGTPNATNFCTLFGR
jgi:hypothetical protein